MSSSFCVLHWSHLSENPGGRRCTGPRGLPMRLDHVNPGEVGGDGGTTQELYGSHERSSL